MKSDQEFKRNKKFFRSSGKDGFPKGEMGLRLVGEAFGGPEALDDGTSSR